MGCAILYAFANVKTLRILCLDTRTHVCYLALFFFCLSFFFFFIIITITFFFFFANFKSLLFIVLFVFFLLLLLLFCVFIYTVVPSSESFVKKSFLNVLDRISFTVSI